MATGNDDGGVNQPAGQLFAEQMADLPEDWHDVFEALTAQGKSPTGINATIEYVTTPKTQKKVSQEFNVSEVAIRNLQAAVVALGPIDAKRASTHGGGQMTAMDYCNHISDRLGWDEGTEYSVSEGGGYSSPQPSIRKEGWRSLFQAVASESGGGVTSDKESTDSD